MEIKENEEIIEQTLSFLERMNNYLQKLTKELKKREVLQHSKNLSGDIGFVDDNITSPKKIPHDKILASYESTFLSTFTDLHSRLLKNVGSEFSQFPLRTLSDMGFKRVEMLFGPYIEDGVKLKYVVTSILADYAFIGEKWIGDFSNLYERYVYIFKDKNKKKIERLLIALKNQNESIIQENTKKLRDFSSSMLPKQTKCHLSIDSSKHKLLYGAFSHLLHGNPFLLMGSYPILSKPYQHNMRVYWFLLNTGINVSYYVSKYLDDVELMKEFETLDDEYKNLMPRLSEFWKQFG